LFVVFKKDMNTKPKLPKIEYWLLTSRSRDYERYEPHLVRWKRRLADGRPRMRSVTQSGAASFNFVIWMVCCLVTILGVIKAAHSEQPLLWLAVWPIPVTLACTIFIFFRQGFHFEDGVLVLGRRAN
jgi:hypothetical protein